MQQKGMKSKRGFNPKLLYIENVFQAEKIPLFVLPIWRKNSNFVIYDPTKYLVSLM